MNQRLELRQGQSLVMTPQLQQAIKLLQMSSHELQTFVEAELERNPLLERDDQSDSAPAKPEQADAAAETPHEDVSRTLGDDGATAEKLASMDTDLANVYADEARADADQRAPGAVTDSNWSSLRSSGGGGPDRQTFDLEATLSDERTLADHLTEQLNLTLTDPAQRLIGLHLIGMLNDAGYLNVELSALAEQLGATPAAIEAVLAIVRTFDPPGVFAGDLKECLEIQLKELDRYDPAMQALVENLELLAKRDFAKLKKVCGVDLEDIKDMVMEIRQLNPRPGNVFGSVVVQPVVPDVQVRPAPDGTWLVELNSETLPRVLVNNQYYATVSATSQRDEDKLYLTECLSNATWLVKSLDQRARTILAVSREIVRQQDAFLVQGVEALKPITLKVIAEAIDMHESTISRVTSNKYMAT
ncbi:MAG: RNA polymerase factor sigma-54, partial [Aestuariivirgaceae bacterium]